MTWVSALIRPFTARRFQWHRRLTCASAAAFVVGIPLATYRHADRVVHPAIDGEFQRLCETDANHAWRLTLLQTQRWSPHAPTSSSSSRAALAPGDLVLLMGTGLVSHQITALCYLWTAWRKTSMTYSHLGVIVPLRSPRGENSKDDGLPQYDLYLLEAIDNRDAEAASPGLNWRCSTSAASVAGAAATLETEVGLDRVQLTNPNERIFARKFERDAKSSSTSTGNSGGGTSIQPCYNRLAIRKLSGVEWSAATLAQSDAFLMQHMGRQMDKTSMVVPASVAPSLFPRFFPTPAPPRPTLAGDDVVTCGELVAHYLTAVGVVEPNHAPKDVTDGNVSLRHVAPFYFFDGFTLDTPPHVARKTFSPWRPWAAGPLRVKGDAKYSPEIRIGLDDI